MSEHAVAPPKCENDFKKDYKKTHHHSNHYLKSLPEEINSIKELILQQEQHKLVLALSIQKAEKSRNDLMQLITMIEEQKKSCEKIITEYVTEKESISSNNCIISTPGSINEPVVKKNMKTQPCRRIDPCFINSLFFYSHINYLKV